MILVNATSAHAGGARSVLLSLLDYLKISNIESHTIFVFCPVSFDTEDYPDNIIFFNRSYRGFLSIIFNVFAVNFYAYYLNCSLILSLNNYNTPFNFYSKITYFHNEKIFKFRGLRFRLLRLLLLLNKHSLYIVQSEHIRRSLRGFFKSDLEVLVLWPGVRQISNSKPSDKFEKFVANNLKGKVALFPIYNFESSHNDKGFFASIVQRLNDFGYLTVSLSKSSPCDINLGYIASRDLDYLYSRCDVLCLCSLVESFSFPLYEYSQTGKPIVALHAEYLYSFLNFAKDYPLLILSHPEDLKLADLQLNVSCHFDSSSVKSDWSFLFRGFYEVSGS